MELDIDKKAVVGLVLRIFQGVIMSLEARLNMLFQCLLLFPWTYIIDHIHFFCHWVILQFYVMAGKNPFDEHPWMISLVPAVAGVSVISSTTPYEIKNDTCLFS